MIVLQAPVKYISCEDFLWYSEIINSSRRPSHPSQIILHIRKVLPELNTNRDMTIIPVCPFGRPGRRLQVVVRVKPVSGQYGARETIQGVSLPRQSTFKSVESN